MPIETKTYKHYWKDRKWWQDEEYVEFPVLTYKNHYTRTKTVERKIKSLLRRGKSFILNTNILTGDDILYVNNCLPFLNGVRPVWGEPPPQRKRRVSIKRGISSRRNAWAKA